MTSAQTSLGGLIRALLAVGGIVVLVLAWPVAKSALLFQKTNAFYAKVREGRPYTSAELQANLATMDAAVVARGDAIRHVQRAELLGSVAASLVLKPSDAQRRAWQQQAKADLEFGLGNNPARTIDWMTLAIIHQWLDGPSRDNLPLLFMSIDTGPMMSFLWEPRLRLILDNWGFFSDEQKQRMGDYVVMMWRKSDDRRFFGRMVYNPIDEVILRYLLQHEPKAMEELTVYVKNRNQR